MFLGEKHSSQRVPSALLLRLESKHAFTDTVAYPRRTKQDRVSHPELGDTSPQAGDTGELEESLYRDLRDRCDRCADRRVLGASLQHRQLELLQSKNETMPFRLLQGVSVFGKEYPGDNASNDPSLQPRLYRSTGPSGVNEYASRASR